MLSLHLINLLVVSMLGVQSVSSFRALFTTRFHDLHYAFMRNGYCKDRWSHPVVEQNMDEAQFLSNQIVRFVEAGDYSSAHLMNISSLMDGICPGTDQDFKISANIDLSKYTGAEGKQLRCKSIGYIMDEIYNVMHAAAVDPSKSMDFSNIYFYAEANNKSSSFPLIDLINTVWIKSEVASDFTCNVTNLVKQSLKGLTPTSTSTNLAEKRSQQESGFFKSFWDYLARFLDPILGLQKRLYWEGSNRVEFLTSTVRGVLGRGYSGAMSFFGRRPTNNSTMTNSTLTNSPMVNSTLTNSTKIVQR